MCPCRLRGSAAHLSPSRRHVAGSSSTSKHPVVTIGSMPLPTTSLAQARCRPFSAPIVALLLAGLVAGCGSSSQPAPAVAASSPARNAALVRATAIQREVRRWTSAQTLAAAKAHAERARNLITGPTVPGAGDADRDGSVKPVAIGLLPGADGSRGLTSALATGCVQRDVLGGSWSRPAARWADVTRRIAEWGPANNTFPGLPSHAQRVVGWASLALRAPRLSDALEYSGHASGHAAITLAAIRSPGAKPCPGG